MSSEKHTSVKQASIALSLLPLGAFLIALLSERLTSESTLEEPIAVICGLAALAKAITSIIWGISIIRKDWRYAGLCIVSGSFYILLTLLPAFA